MPTLLQDCCNCCTTCRRALPENRSHAEVMGIPDDMCIRCFETHYFLCYNCGDLTGRECSYYYEGDSYCCDCYEDLGRSANYWSPEWFNVSTASYQRIRSKRKYGVEIETSQCNGRSQLSDKTLFGCKDDPSVSGAEFDSPILYGDEGLDHISDFLVFAEERDWAVDNACGCHTHYDMRDETDEGLYRIAYAYAVTYKMWKRCVPRHRYRSSYCHSLHYTVDDIKTAYEDEASFMDFAEATDRFNGINLLAYSDHRTFEVRMLEGTIDAETICNWITIHCRFIDYVRKLSFHELESEFDGAGQKQFCALVDLIDDTNLTDWLATRARRIGRQPLRGPGSARP